MQHRKVEMANIKRLIDKEDRVRHCNTYLNWIPKKRMWQSYIQRDINSEYCTVYKLKNLTSLKEEIKKINLYLDTSKTLNNTKDKEILKAVREDKLTSKKMTSDFSTTPMKNKCQSQQQASCVFLPQQAKVSFKNKGKTKSRPPMCFPEGNSQPYTWSIRNMNQDKSVIWKN